MALLKPKKVVPSLTDRLTLAIHQSTSAVTMFRQAKSDLQAANQELSEVALQYEEMAQAARRESAAAQGQILNNQALIAELDKFLPPAPAQ